MKNSENMEPVNILLVEDDPAHAEITIRNFRKNQFPNRIFHLSDGRQALDFLYRLGDFSDPESSPRPHLILLDLRLPKIDGLEVLRDIKSNKSLHCIPVIILSTSEAEIDIAKAYDLNVNSYLVKPIDFEKFSNLLEVFGFYWVEWNKYHPCK
jgi:CheY-like chemotaxis protein